MLVIFENEALSRLGDAFLERERHDLVVRLCDECRTWNGWEALAPEVARLLKKIPNSAMTQARRCSEECVYADKRPFEPRAIPRSAEWKATPRMCIGRHAGSHVPRLGAL